MDETRHWTLGVLLSTWSVSGFIILQNVHLLLTSIPSEFFLYLESCSLYLYLLFTLRSEKFWNFVESSPVFQNLKAFSRSENTISIDFITVIRIRVAGSELGTAQPQLVTHIYHTFIISSNNIMNIFHVCFKMTILIKNFFTQI